MEKKEIRTVIIFPIDLWEQGKNQAMKERISLGELMRKSLREYLKRQTTRGKKK